MTKQFFPTTIEIDKLADGKAHVFYLERAPLPAGLGNLESPFNISLRIEVAKLEESEFKIDTYEEAVATVLALTQKLFPTFEQLLAYDGGRI